MADTGSGYHAAYQAWRRDPEGFWAEAARAIDWFRPWDRVFDPNQGLYGRWFPGARANTCHNCLDRHVAAGRGAQAALIYDSPVTGTKATYSYARLLDEVRAFAKALRRQGVEYGDRVVIYMPMVPEAAIAMLACARLGAIHSVVFGGFAARELAIRIDDATPKAIVSASCGIEPSGVVAYKPLIDRALEIAAHAPAAHIVLQRRQGPAELSGPRERDWREAVAEAADDPEVDCVSVAATDPVYILYTSGTTGKPKGVVRDTGGHMVALKWSMEHFYGVRPGDVWWTASDVGWVVGHSYIVYAPLLHGATSVLFEGKPVGPPDAGVFWRVAAEHKVAALFTAPTAFRAIKRADPHGALMEGHDLSAFRTLFLAGERADPDTIKWAEDRLKVPVIDHWWQTETGWCMAGNPVGLGTLPVKYGSPCVPMPGYDVRVVDEGGREVPRGTLGNIVVSLPLPPSGLPTLWNDDARAHEAYFAEFPGAYKTGDAGYVDEDGYVFVMARTDDIINVAGHRLSTGAMEEAIANHPDVAECAVVGVADALKGQVPVGFLVLKAGVSRPSGEIAAEAVAGVRREVGPVAAFKTAVIVERLPKTRSGKILRGTMRKMIDGEDYTVPATIDDPAILDEIAAALSQERTAGTA